MNEGQGKVNEPPPEPWGLARWFLLDLTVGLVIVWLFAACG